jgi:hypothetical protein
MKTMNRIQIAIALVSSLVTLAVCIAAAVTASPVLTAICPMFGVGSFIAGSCATESLASDSRGRVGPRVLGLPYQSSATTPLNSALTNPAK